MGSWECAACDSCSCRAQGTALTIDTEATQCTAQKPDSWHAGLHFSLIAHPAAPAQLRVPPCARQLANVAGAVEPPTLDPCASPKTGDPCSHASSFLIDKSACPSCLHSSTPLLTRSLQRHLLQPPKHLRGAARFPHPCRAATAQAPCLRFRQGELIACRSKSVMLAPTKNAESSWA